MRRVWKKNNSRYRRNQNGKKHRGSSGRKTHLLYGIKTEQNWGCLWFLAHEHDNGHRLQHLQLYLIPRILGNFKYKYITLFSSLLSYIKETSYTTWWYIGVVSDLLTCSTGWRITVSSGQKKSSFFFQFFFLNEWLDLLISRGHFTLYM